MTPVRLGEASVRAQRAWGTFRSIHRETGSLATALVYSGRYLRSKLPVLFRHIGAAGRRRSVEQEIDAGRQAVAGGRPFLAIRVIGGIGDYIVLARFARDLAARTEGFGFDIYASNPGLADWLFGSLPGFRQSYHDILFETSRKRYDAALRADHVVIAYPDSLEWSRLSESPLLAAAIRRIIQYRPKIEIFIKHHPNMDNFLALRAVYANATRLDFLHHIAGLSYGGDRLDVAADAMAPSRNGLASRRYVTVHNGFDPGFIITSEQATKCYPHFAEVVRLLKRQFPDLTFVQVGTSTSIPIPGIDVDLINHTSLTEVAGIIAGAALHIDNEGGLVHLARCYGVCSCVVFGPTPSNYFGYGGNINVDPTFCGGCWWINQTWMDYCPRGFSRPRCMTEQDPAAVAKVIAAFLMRDAARTAPLAAAPLADPEPTLSYSR